MANNTSDDELREAIKGIKKYGYQFDTEVIDEVMQLINSEVHKVLDRLDERLKDEISIGPRNAIQAERNKYLLNKETR